MSFNVYYYYYFCTKRHHCHYGACPPCHQSCDLTLSCGHVCTARCHDNKPDLTKLTKVCTLSLCLNTFHQALIISQETSGFFNNISVYVRSSNIIFFFQPPLTGWPSPSNSNSENSALQPMPCPPCVVPVEM